MEDDKCRVEEEDVVEGSGRRLSARVALPGKGLDLIISALKVYSFHASKVTLELRSIRGCLAWDSPIALVVYGVSVSQPMKVMVWLYRNKGRKPMPLHPQLGLGTPLPLLQQAHETRSLQDLNILPGLE